MGAHLDRALVLLQQSRHDLAEQEVRQELAGNPDHALAHAVLGLCLSAREDFREGTREAQTAIALAPDEAFCHYALASIFYRRARFDEALGAIQEALRLQPYDADYVALLSEIYYQKRCWREALEAAERGLALDPEHVDCTNYRAQALVKLGRRAEAGATLDTALAREPENALTHATLGWSLLEKGDQRKALEHFREALRLDPEMELARVGIVEALKARHLLYKPILWFFLWMAKLSHKAQWGVIIGGYIGYRVLSGLADANPELKPWVWPVLGLYLGFVFLTWVADPLFNLLLRLDRFGRLTLSRDQVVASNWVGGCLLAGLAVAAAGWWLHNPLVLSSAIYFAVLIIPLAATFHCSPGMPRLLMGGYTALMALTGLAGTGLLFLRVYTPRGQYPFAQEWGQTALGLFVMEAICSGWVANGLMMIRPKR